jgi:hypothetical protein
LFEQSRDYLARESCPGPSISLRSRKAPLPAAPVQEYGDQHACPNALAESPFIIDQNRNSAVLLVVENNAKIMPALAGKTGGQHKRPA